MLVTFLSNHLGSLNAPLVLLLEHVDLDLMVSLQETDFFFESDHCLFLVVDVFLALGVQLEFQVFVLLFEQFKHALLVLKLILQAFCHMFKFFDVVLHVLKEGLLLVFLLLLVSGLL